MPVSAEVARDLANTSFLNRQGAYFIVDGQFGSTGKGLAAAMVAEAIPHKIDIVASNAGPNSGHTSYFRDEKIVLMQLPSSAVTLHKMGRYVEMYLNAGAIIDHDRLCQEIAEHNIRDGLVWVHPHAALVDDLARSAEEGIKLGIGSTGKGTGAALASKVMRTGKVVSDVTDHPYRVAGFDLSHAITTKLSRVLVEVSQGFSLGINSGFYPFTTSRECDVSQAMSDAGLHPNHYGGAMMVVRTFPIRVGGNSGPHYPDQREITWADLDVEPEKTTVTQKVRRVFTWSNIQFREALVANRPEIIFLNFCNYLKPSQVRSFVQTNILANYLTVMKRKPSALFLGFGPRTNEVASWNFDRGDYR